MTPRRLRWQALDPLAGFTLMVTPNVEQRTFRFRNDDGSQTTATWKATQGTSITGVTTSERFRVRYEMQETAGGDTTSITFSLEYMLNDSGTWVAVTTTSNVVRIVSSTGVSNGTATTNQLTLGTGTFLAGQVLTTANSAATSMTANNHTEYEWNLQLVAGTVSNNDVIALRCMTSTGARTVGAAGNGTVTASVAPNISASFLITTAVAVTAVTTQSIAATAVINTSASVVQASSKSLSNAIAIATIAGVEVDYTAEVGGGGPTGLYAPTLVIERPSATQVDLSWDTVAAASKYRLQRQVYVDPSWVDDAEFESVPTSTTDYVTSGPGYRYRIKSIK
jgi:hypothetical protein